MQPQTLPNSIGQAAASARYLSVDALRGLIMIIMAIDHSSAFVAREHGAEFWAGAMSTYTSAFPFLTRWITHLCAPGFFFLMGAGVYWMAAAWRDSGTDASRRIVWRGVVLLLLAQVVELPIMFLQSILKPPQVSLIQTAAPPPNDGSALFWGFITLSGLGMVLIACGLLLRLKPWAWLVVSALCFIATNSLLPSSGQPGAWWIALLLAPGLSQHIIVIYPLIPWLAGAAAGMYLAHWWRKHPDKAEARAWMIGLSLLIVAAALRAGGGWGNIRPPRDSGWIEFLNNVKYPPSLVFWCMTMGINLVLLTTLSRLPRPFRAAGSPLIVFGQTPLFFYVAHFWLLAVYGLLLFREPASLEMAYVVWAIVLVALYPACAWYRRFKSGKPKDSLWRMF